VAGAVTIQVSGSVPASHIEQI